LTSLLTTARTFVDQTDRNLKHRYGKTSVRVKAFKRATSEAYDNNFSYRFFYKLRNYVQHCGLPLGRMSIRIKKESEPSGLTSQTIKFEFDRDLLLERFDKWGEPVQSELAVLPAYFSIRPLVEEFIGVFDVLQTSLTAEEGPALLDALSHLDKIALEAAWRGGEPAVCIESAVDDDPDNYCLQFQHFPVEMMDMIRKPAHRVFGVETVQFFA
jgi:hypothetical protein